MEGMPFVDDNELNRVEYLPFRKKGLLIYGAAIVVLLGGGITAMIFAIRGSGWLFAVLLIAALLQLGAAPLLGYRLYGLLNGSYTLTREGVQIRWGLRVETIPMRSIEWARGFESIGLEVALPRAHWSGIVVGNGYSRELGEIEFLGDDPDSLILIAARQKVYAISPESPNEFLRDLRDRMESGSLYPLSAETVLPSTFISRLWDDRAARGLIAGGLLFNLGLVILVQLIIPMQEMISIGFDSQGNPLPATPTSGLNLLSVFSFLFFFLDLGLGYYFFRKAEHKPIAYMLWGAGLVVPIFLMLALVLF